MLGISRAAPILLAGLMMGAVTIPYARPVACGVAHAERHAAEHVAAHRTQGGPALTDAGTSCHDVMLCCAVDGARTFEPSVDFIVILHQSYQPLLPAQRPAEAPPTSLTPPPRV